MPRKKTSLETEKRGRLFSKQIKELREKMRLTQAELSSQAGIPLDTIRALESGRVKAPSLFLAADLVRTLKGSLDCIVQKRK